MRPRAEVQKFVDVLTSEMPSDLSWSLSGAWRRGAGQLSQLDVLILLSESDLQSGRSVFGEDPGQLGVALIMLPRSLVQISLGGRSANGMLVHPDNDRLLVQFWVPLPKQMGALNMHLTGPPALNEIQRRIARNKGCALSPVGLFRDGSQVDDGTEHGIYQVLGMPFIEPYNRQRFASTKDVGNKVVTRVKSDSGSGEYVVTLNPDTCNCKYREYHPSELCKHITRVKNSLRAGADA